MALHEFTDQSHKKLSAAEPAPLRNEVDVGAEATGDRIEYRPLMVELVVRVYKKPLRAASVAP